jgi:hypothetical protein
MVVHRNFPLNEFKVRKYRFVLEVDSSTNAAPRSHCQPENRAVALPRYRAFVGSGDGIEGPRKYDSSSRALVGLEKFCYISLLYY